jgi:hypothetical protein
VFILKKIFFSRTSRPISIKHGTNHPWVKGVLNYTKRKRKTGPAPLQRGDNNKIAKYDIIEKFIPPEPLSQNGSYLHESVLTKCRFKFVQIMVPGARGNEKGHNRENHIYMCLY